MMRKTFFYSFMFLLFVVSSARAELSANPWLEPNTEEDIAEVYRSFGNMKNVSKDMMVTYTRIDEKTSSNKGVFAKIKGMFKSKGKRSQSSGVSSSSRLEQKVQARRSSMNGRKKVAARRSAGGKVSGGMFSGVASDVDFSGLAGKVKGFNLKSLSNAFK